MKHDLNYILISIFIGVIMFVSVMCTVIWYIEYNDIKFTEVKPEAYKDYNQWSS